MVLKLDMVHNVAIGEECPCDNGVVRIDDLAELAPCSVFKGCRKSLTIDCQ